MATHIIMFQDSQQNNSRLTATYYDNIVKKKLHQTRFDFWRISDATSTFYFQWTIPLKYGDHLFQWNGPLKIENLVSVVDYAPH